MKMQGEIDLAIVFPPNLILSIPSATNIFLFYCQTFVSVFNHANGMLYILLFIRFESLTPVPIDFDRVPPCTAICNPGN